MLCSNKNIYKYEIEDTMLPSVKIVSAEKQGIEIFQAEKKLNKIYENNYLYLVN